MHVQSALEGISKTVGTICPLFANSSTARRILNFPFRCVVGDPNQAESKSTAL